MRRKELEIRDLKQIEAMIQAAEICHLAMCDNDLPYSIPMNFGYAGQNLYLHSAGAGRKISLMQKNPRVAFHLIANYRIKPAATACSWSVAYQSVAGIGKITVLNTPEEKSEALQLIFQHYAGTEDRGSWPDTMLEKTLVLRLAIEEMTGKQHA